MSVSRTIRSMARGICGTNYWYLVDAILHERNGASITDEAMNTAVDFGFVPDLIAAASTAQTLLSCDRNPYWNMEGAD